MGREACWLQPELCLLCARPEFSADPLPCTQRPQFHYLLYSKTQGLLQLKGARLAHAGNGAGMAPPLCFRYSCLQACLYFSSIFQTKTTVKGLPGLGLAWSSQLIDKAQEACTPSVLAYPAMPPGLTLRCSLTLSLSMDHWVHPILCIPVNLGFKCN